MTYKAYKKGILQRLKRMDDGIDTNQETEIALRAMESLFQGGLQVLHSNANADLGPDPSFDDSGDIDEDALVAEYVNLPLEQFEMHRQAINKIYDLRNPLRKSIVDVG